jgi:hypothetical protein
MGDALSRRYGDLLVCGTCGQVKGVVPQRSLGGEERTQLCHCAPADEHCAQPRFGRDFARWWELCYCCGLDTVESGSRWSVFHCEHCRIRVRALNDLMARCVIPLGRHSLMNGVALAEPACRPDAAVVSFSDQLGTLFASIDDLAACARARVLSNLSTLGVDAGTDVVLAGYLRNVQRRHLSKDQAFSALVERILGPDGRLIAALTTSRAER